MKFKLDENLPVDLLADFEAAGHEVDSVQGEGLRGSPDGVILETARAHGRVLVTLDKGLGNIREYPPEDHAGIILFRPRSLDRDSLVAFVRTFLPGLLQLHLAGHLFVITPGGVRIH